MASEYLNIKGFDNRIDYFIFSLSVVFTITIIGIQSDGR